MARTKETTRPAQPGSPYLPTRTETLLLAVYPALLVFGALFSLISPQTRSAPMDPYSATQAHAQDPALAPSYFARKDNVFNIFFVKRGWAWVSAAFFLFVLTHPLVAAAPARAKAVVRWGLVTAWWGLVTQWCFGPPLIDRGFRFTGGRCELVEQRVEAGGPTSPLEAVTAAACKSSGGRWSGGHDISGHVFLLVLGSFFLLQEVGWAARRWTGWGSEERSIATERSHITGRSAIERAGQRQPALRAGVGAEAAPPRGLLFADRFAAAVVVLSWWMVLMTAIYFHTWFEKLTGLLVALAGVYVVYILPRWVPALRSVVGMPQLDF